MRYRSALFGRIDGLPLPVEVMAGPELFSGNRWRPVRFTTREPVGVGETAVYIPARAELAALLAAIGRPKDVERLVMLGA